MISFLSGLVGWLDGGRLMVFFFDMESLGDLASGSRILYDWRFL